MSFRLYSDREATGALNLYADNAFACTEGAEEVGLVHDHGAGTTSMLSRRSICSKSCHKNRLRVRWTYADG